jgi:RHS repeat-associated protein
VPGATTYYFYDPAGRLLTETNGMPGSGKDYLYLVSAPLARVDWSVAELDLAGSPLRVNKNSPNVRLDWTLFPAASNTYIVRRKQVVNPNDKTFSGSSIIATPIDSVRIYDDPVLNDGNRYDYSVFSRSANDALFYYHADVLGTPIAMTDGSAAPVWRAEPLPFGGLSSLPISTVQNNLRLPGQYFDAETSLHQNAYRDYAARTGRYYEPDPLGLSEAGGTSGPGLLFGYARNAPTVVADPLGLVPTSGCPPDRARALDTAAQQAEAASRTCVPCAGRDRPRLTNLFRNTTLHCVSYFEQGVVGIPSERCAQGSDAHGTPTGHDIAMLDPAFEEIDPKRACGCLQATVLHEVLHLFNPSLDEEQVMKGVRKCFNCAQQW